MVTAPDARRGRGSKLVPTPVKRCAVELGLRVSESARDVVGADVELGVVVAYGSLIGADVLAAVPMVNLHFSLLPRWRGAAPVERAILAGDERTGVCLMALEPSLDTGPLYDRVEVAIGPDETADELTRRLGALGTAMLLERLAGGPASLGVPMPQVGEPVYAAKITPGERHLDWQLPAVALGRVVRIGRAWTTFRSRRLIVERARPVDDAAGESRAEPAGTLVGAEVVCGSGRLALVRVRPEGRGVLDFDAWRRGARPQPGERLGQ